MRYLQSTIYNLQYVKIIPYKPKNFPGFLFATANVAYITAMIILHLINFACLQLPSENLAVFVRCPSVAD